MECLGLRTAARGVRASNLTSFIFQARRRVVQVQIENPAVHSQTPNDHVLRAKHE